MDSYEEECFNEIADQVIKYKDEISSNPDEWISCTESDIKIGDIIYVYYMPDSQRYMFTHSPECGQVIDIINKQFEAYNDKIQDELCIIINNHNSTNVFLNKDHLSIYSTGYYMSINKYVKI